MESVENIVIEEIEYYGGGGAENIRQFTFVDDKRKHYGVLSLTDPREDNPRMDVIFMVRIQGDFVVIEEDYTADFAMLEALQSRGIPRDKIVCTFWGETLPTSDPVEASE